MYNILLTGATDVNEWKKSTGMHLNIHRYINLLLLNYVNS